MTRLYKLTDRQESTYNDTVWGENVTHSIPADRPGFKLCSSQVIHAYEHPVIAVLLNPVHAGFYHPLLWEAEGEVVVREGQLKCGVKKLTTLRQIPLPVGGATRRLNIAIRCALLVYTEARFVAWANNWLDGSDRTQDCAHALSYDMQPEEGINQIIRNILYCATCPRNIMMPYYFERLIASTIQITYRMRQYKLDLVGIIKAADACPWQTL